MAEKNTGVIVGIDTHKKFHTVAVIASTGKELAVKNFDANAEGYRQALRWMCGFGHLLRAGIESTGSYGAGICSYLQKEGIETLDVYAADKRRRRREGKNNERDAFQAAEAALSNTRCAPAKNNGENVRAACLLETTYEQAVKQRTASINALRAAIVTAPANLRERLDHHGREKLISTCANFRIQKKDMGLEGAVRLALRTMAKRIQTLDEEIAALHKEIECYAKMLAPKTLSLFGVGCHGAIRLLGTAGENIGRMKGEASFSMLCGVSPIPASTGDIYHHRLNRGGNRRANSVIHTMAITRLRHDKKTQGFIQRKMSEGKSKKDAIRSLKRYLAREAFCALKEDMAILAI